MKIYGELYKGLKAANKKTTKSLSKYKYPQNVITSTKIADFSKYDVNIEISKNDCFFINKLDAQKTLKKSMFGAGFLVSDKVTKQIMLGQNKLEQNKLEQETICFELSDRERKIIDELNYAGIVCNS